MRALFACGLMALALFAHAGTEIVQESSTAAARGASVTALEVRHSANGGFASSSLQVGCANVTTSACRRADSEVEVGSIYRSNRASGGTAIQETLIGSAR